MDIATETTTEAPTLGEIAEIFKTLQGQGVTLGSMEYVLERVYWAEMDEEAATRKRILKALEESNSRLKEIADAPSKEI